MSTDPRLTPNQLTLVLPWEKSEICFMGSESNGEKLFKGKCELPS